ICAVLAGILPAILLLAFAKARVGAVARGIQLASAVLLAAQLIGNLATFFSALFVIGNGAFDWLPGCTVLSDFIGIFRSLFHIGWYGVFYTLRYAVAALLLCASSAILLCSNVLVLLISTEFVPFPAAVPARSRVYEMLGFPPSPVEALGGMQQPLFSSSPREESDTMGHNESDFQSTVGAGHAARPTTTPFELTQTKNIALCVLFSFLTCSIYYFYWKYTMMRRIRLLNGDDSSPILELVWMLIPGVSYIYGLYWYFTRAGKLSDGAAHYDVSIVNNSILYLVLAVLGFTLINDCLIQNDLNTIARTLNHQSFKPNLGTQFTDEVHKATQSAAESLHPTHDPMERLVKLNELLKAGIITQAEFDERKAALLKQI
ncbi:MAG: DUF4234 domain-containing protein, partial [Oscillospiraceae bacterium]|nr:DUF4234 domain-containing protein [Oscillospiraceae bacterium]